VPIGHSADLARTIDYLIQVVRNVRLISDMGRTGQGSLAESDVEYFQRRAREERAAAKRAADVRAQQAHVELAERYEEVAEAIAGSTPMLEAVPARESALYPVTGQSAGR